MKKWLIFLLMLPVLCFAGKPYHPWEEIPTPNGGFYGEYMYRMSVPHGWLVFSRGNRSSDTVFIPDENHEWILEE